MSSSLKLCARLVPPSGEKSTREKSLAPGTGKFEIPRDNPERRHRPERVATAVRELWGHFARPLQSSVRRPFLSLLFQHSHQVSVLGRLPAFHPILALDGISALFGGHRAAPC